MIPLLLIRIELRIKNIDAGFLNRVKYDLRNYKSGILPMKFDTLKNKRVSYELSNAKMHTQWN
jgi:hypothetical protein